MSDEKGLNSIECIDGQISVVIMLLGGILACMKRDGDKSFNDMIDRVLNDSSEVMDMLAKAQLD